MRRLLLAVCVTALLALALPQGPVWAIDTVANETDFVDGAIGIVDPIIPSKGGLGANITASDDGVLIGDGSAFAVNVVPDCDADGAQLTYDTATNAFGCETLADADIPDTITIDHSTTGTLTLDQTTGPTAEGLIAWDATANEIEIGDGAATERFIPVGTTTDGNFCTYDSTANEIDCATATVGVNPVLHFSTMGTVQGGSTVYANGANISATENNVEVAHEALSFNNLRCEATAAITGANTVTINGRKGTCGTLADDADMSCVITGGATSCSDTGALDLTVGQCLSWALVWSGTAETATVNCSVERTG